MGFIKETIARISADSPTYFKKVGNFGIGLTASGTSMLATGALPATVHIPPVIGTAGGYMLVAGFVMTAVAKLTCSDPPAK